MITPLLLVLQLFFKYSSLLLALSSMFRYFLEKKDQQLQYQNLTLLLRTAFKFSMVAKTASSVDSDISAI